MRRLMSPQSKGETVSQQTKAMRTVIENTLAGAITRTVLIGETAHVFIFIEKEADHFAKRIERLAMQAIDAEATVTEKGVSRWLVIAPLFDHTKEGSARYTWDTSGNRVRVERYIKTRLADGTLDTEFDGCSWKSYNSL